MKTTTPLTSVEAPVEDANNIKMTIDPSGMDFIMQRLTNLYSEPELAALREYFSNALDSHIKSGTSAPVLVTIPQVQKLSSSSSLYNRVPGDLIIQDFGVGLSRSDISDIYSRYGASTKRDSNKEMGGFGLGAKSALAVSDSFSLVGVKDGIKTVADIGKSKSGAGYVTIKSSEPTSEANGVKVTIPIPFNKIVSALSLDNIQRAQIFAAVPSGEVQVRFGSHPGTLCLMDNIFQDSFQPIVTGFGTSGWVGPGKAGGALPSAPSLFAVVGKVVYNIKINSMEETSENLSALDQLFHDVYLNLPIGSVDLTPSREELIYSSRTVQSIKVVAESTKMALESIFKDSVASAKDRKDASAIAVKLAKNKYWGSAELRWHGENVPIQLDFEGKFGKVSRIVKKKNVIENTFLPKIGTPAWYSKQNIVVKVENNLNFDYVAHEISRIILKFAKAYAGDSSQAYEIWVQKENLDNSWVVEGCVYKTLEELQAEAKEIDLTNRAAAKQKTVDSLTQGSAAAQSKPGNLYYVMDCDEFEMETSRWFTLTGKDVTTLNPADVLYLHPRETMHRILKNCVPSTSPSAPARVYQGDLFKSLAAHLPGKKIVFLKTSQSAEKLAAVIGVNSVPEVYGAVRPTIYNKIVKQKEGLIQLSTAQRLATNMFTKTVVAFLEQLPDATKKILPVELQQIFPFLQETKVPEVKEAAALTVLWRIDGPKEISDSAIENIRKIEANAELFPLLTYLGTYNLTKISQSHLVDYVKKVAEAKTTLT